MARSKQSTRLDKEEEKKEKFNFTFFSSYFDTATIAAGKEMEKAAAREPEWTPPRRRTPLTRTAAGPGGGWELATMVDNAAVQSDVASADNARAARCNNQPVWGAWTNHGQSTYPVRRSGKDEEGAGQG